MNEELAHNCSVGQFTVYHGPHLKIDVFLNFCRKVKKLENDKHDDLDVVLYNMRNMKCGVLNRTLKLALCEYTLVHFDIEIKPT